ncbi:MAG: glycosyl hydrolase family 2, partial [Bacteroidota bacterium]|nr:glycosyl hydrolase family 2 [Bacteroidota bacterium]
MKSNLIKNLLVVVFISLLCVVRTIAQTNPSAITKMISFTTQTSLKLEVSFAELPENNSTYQIKITSQEGTVLNDAPATPSILREEKKLVFHINNLHPELWTPTAPKLYQLLFAVTSAANKSAEQMQRIGFRFFESKNGNLYLNGKPVFLRGIAINPPARGIPDSIEKSRKFAEDYVRFMKSIHVNILRIPNDETWYNVCDELGMMVFGGNYSGTVDDEKPPKNYDKAVAWYKNDAFATIAHHPSLMMYAMTNEVPFEGAIAMQWEKFLSYAYSQLKNWDSTRVYIANAGYGYGKSGDVCDLHRYWGWYYCSPFTFLHIRNNEDIIPFKKPTQPITFTECVGNYTGPDGRYNLTPDHKNPGSQLNWTGHADESIQARLADEHQSLTFKQATELFRRLRVINPELSGVFPFTILFYNWNNVQQFIDMGPKPVTKQTKLSYQPLLTSWENWTTQVYAGSIINPIVHIVNDDDAFKDLTGAKFVYQLMDDATTVFTTDTIALPPIIYYSTWQKRLTMQLPEQLAMGNYNLVGKIIKGGKIVSENFDKLFIAGKEFTATAIKPKQKILLYDPAGKTAASFEKLLIPYQRIASAKNIPAASLLVIGENAMDNTLMEQATAIKQFVKKGGRILLLRQDEEHLPAANKILEYAVKNVTINLDTALYPPPPRPSRNGYYVNPERPDHPVFYGINREQLKVWSDYTKWDESKKGFPAIYPVTDGYVPVNKKDIE